MDKTLAAYIPVVSENWWWQAMTSRLSLCCMGIIALALLFLLLAVRAAWRLGRARRVSTDQHLPLYADTGATATIEFALVFPILLFMILILTQTTMLMAGNLFVHYAAFAAARSAIVQIPTDQSPDEPANNILDAPGMPKHEAIRLAAVAAVLPASGRLSTGAVSATAFVTALNAHYAAFSQAAPAWVANLAADRFRYADANTFIHVMYATVDSPTSVIFTALPTDSLYAFGPRDPITAVRVTHNLSLVVPYVSVLFSDGVHTPETGTGRYALVNAQATLSNEGIPDVIVPPNLPRSP